MHEIYVIRNINYSLSSKNSPIKNPINFTKALRISTKRKNIIIDYSNVKIPDRTCCICKLKMNHDNYIFKYNLNEDDSYDMIYDKHPNDKPYGDYHKCLNCVLEKLNPNSIEAVSMLYNLDNETANKLILSRNKSPFYGHNHTEPDSYKTFQSHKKIKETNPELVKLWKDKGLKTYYKNKENYILKYGIDKWDELCKNKDSMSEEHHKKKYGEEYEKYLIERKNGVSSRRPTNFNKEDSLKWLNSKRYNINSKEDLYSYLDNYMQNKMIISCKFFIDLAFKIIESGDMSNAIKRMTCLITF